MNVSRVVAVLLEDLDGVEYFLGGSRRFQYDTENSDIDLFLFVPKALNTPESMVDYLTSGDSNGLERVLDAFGIPHYMRNGPTENQYDMGNFHFVTTLLGIKLDLIIFTDNKAFKESQAEHVRVEKYLDLFPESRQYIKAIPGPGKLKYRAMLQRIRDLAQTSKE